MHPRFPRVNLVTMSGFPSLFPFYGMIQGNSEKSGLAGRASDIFGESDLIEVNYISEQKLEFVKIYQGGGGRIQYKFDWNKSGFWVGRFAYEDDTVAQGVTHCLTIEVPKNFWETVSLAHQQ